LVRQANDLIDKLQLEKRLIAIPANPVQVCSETRRTFERIGVSLQLWEKFDGLLAVGLLSMLQSQGGTALGDVLQALPRSFPHAALIVVESCAGAGLERAYYAAEMRMLARLSHGEPRPAAAWEDQLKSAGYQVDTTLTLHTDGVTIFVCPAPRPRRRAGAARQPAGEHAG
jgi:hypothetical protein